MTAKQFTLEQLQLMEKARTIRARFPKWAEEFNAHDLKALAREMDWLGNQLEIAIANQQRVFKFEHWGTTQEEPTKPSDNADGRSPQNETLF